MGTELGMEFGAPEHLVWIWVVPLAMLALWFAEKKRRQRLKLVGALEPTRVSAFGASGREIVLSGFRTFVRMTMLGLGLTSLVLALAKPRWGFEWIDAKQRGADIMIAVDVSKSMLAPDISPSRLERARRKVSDLLDRMSGDRVGLVAFAGTAFVQCPLTMDYGAVRLFLSYLDPDLIPTQGTDLGAAIELSLAGLFDGAPEGATTGRAIIIMTDGEDQEGRGQRAAAAAKEKGVKIYTIGIGTEEGTLIPEPGGGFLKDRNGNLVVSRPNEGALKAVAEASGGAYVRSVAGDGDIKFIYDRGILNDINRDELQEVRTKKWHERFQWFLAAAFVFLFTEPLVRDVKGAKMKKPGATLLALLIGFFSTGRADAASLGDAHQYYKNKEYEAAAKEFAEVEQERPDDPEVTYNRAVSQYRSGDFKGAAEGFGRAAGASDPALQEKAWYNMGNALAYQQKFEDAVKSYENALKVNPENQKAKENLALVKKLLEQQKQQQQQQSSSDQKQDQKQEQNQDQQEQNQDQQEQKGEQEQQEQKGEQKQNQQEQNQQEQNQQEQNQQEQNQQQSGESDKQPSERAPQPSEGQDQKEQNGDEKKEQQQSAGDEQQQPQNEEQQNSNHNQKDKMLSEKQEHQQYSKDQALQLLRSVQDQIKKYRYMEQNGQDQRQDPEKNW